ncbi:uncharacterized protein EHS24_000163 [Apiotrichum porosum]|uniref:Uncharacterized protein n=1 Tax=Apiotrichum porosum TaxID=105984 RepID=A0A427Y936_9TREE|nr:uncharacterized protein EHS24_000163 [Apiotrichum porosum]RSH87650.1 hypothetical protein EHS24_000163 [Apiotrichum porosum]
MVRAKKKKAFSNTLKRWHIWVQWEGRSEEAYKADVDFCLRHSATVVDEVSLSNVVVVELAVPHVHPYVHVCVTRHGFGLDGLVFKFADLEESPAADQGGTNFPGEDGTAADVGEKTDDVEEGGEEDVDADLEFLSPPSSPMERPRQVLVDAACLRDFVARTIRMDGVQPYVLDSTDIVRARTPTVWLQDDSTSDNSHPSIVEWIARVGDSQTSTTESGPITPPLVEELSVGGIPHAVQGVDAATFTTPVQPAAGDTPAPATAETTSSASSASVTFESMLQEELDNEHDVFGPNTMAPKRALSSSSGSSIATDSRRPQKRPRMCWRKRRAPQKEDVGGREGEEGEDTTTAGGTAAVLVVGQSDEEEDEFADNEEEEFADNDDEEFASDDDEEFASDDDEEFASDDDEEFAGDDDEEFASDDDEEFASDDDEEFAGDDDEEFASDDDEEFASDDDEEFAGDDDEEFASDDDEEFASDDDDEEESADEEELMLLSGITLNGTIYLSTKRSSGPLMQRVAAHGNVRATLDITKRWFLHRAGSVRQSAKQTPEAFCALGEGPATDGGIDGWDGYQR